MNNDCPFCNTTLANAKCIAEYDHWNLFLQSTEKRAVTRQSAGFLASKRHFKEPVEATDKEWVELRSIIKDASLKLCQEADTTYIQQEIVGFNQGLEAGQTVPHAHIHILPVVKEDPEELKIRAGIGGAFEALHRERLTRGIITE